MFAGQVLKIYLKFRRGEIPPNFDVEHTGIVLFSQSFHEYDPGCS